MIRSLLARFRRNHRTQLSSRSAYARWAHDYPPTPHNRLMEIEQDSMLALMPPLENKRVLDLACGTGRYELIAQQHGVSLVLGIDNSYHMLAQFKLPNFVLGNMARIPLGSMSVDVVICGLAVGHYSNLAVIMSEISRVLTPRGYAIVSDFHPFQYLTGARRTFRVGQSVYEVEHYAHLYETIHQTTKQAGLMIDAIHEPTVDGGKLPVVLVYRLQKRAR